MAQLVQQQSERSGSEIDGDAIYRLFRQHFVADAAPVQLNGYRLVSAGHDQIEVDLLIDGAIHHVRGEGEGAISAFIDAWNRHSGQQLGVVDYCEHAIGEGTDAEAVAYMQVNIEGARVSGAAFDQDTVSASLKALLSAINRARRASSRAA